MNVGKLLNELMNDVNYSLNHSNSMSDQAKEILSEMKAEFETINADHSLPDQQKKMIALFMGGIILALRTDDLKYSYANKLYPGTAIDNTLTKLRSEERTKLPHIAFMYELGKQALLNLPNDFSGDLFKIKTQLKRTNKPTAFFPKLEKNSHKVDALVAFCIEHKNNLELSDTNKQLETPEGFVQAFSKKHEASYKKGLFGSFFHKTNLKKPYDDLTPKDILEHAKEHTFLGFKNRTRKILEKMEVLDKQGNLINNNVFKK
jgi:hypothetical protein